ncbi:MAG TPA: V-type ATP synthase subunit D [Syntrophorhabdaceae bacterium]|nr:V-type ATP synthase subunit D [Syntrophorhabdaceae bacterium]
MAKLNIAPTKSNLLTLQRQLEFAEEGYDLLEQKRQILIFELMSRLERARETEQRVVELLKKAFTALQNASMDIGSEALEKASMAVKMEHEIEITDQHLMGMRIPRIKAKTELPGVHFGITGTSASADMAMEGFVNVLPVIAELAELSNAVIRLAQELRKTQRRCNALSKIFMPSYKETINYIIGTLEERERESFVIMKMVRDRLEQSMSDND